MTQDRPEIRSSRAAKAIVVLLCIVPMIGTLLFGAVDSWTIGLLSILLALITILWFLDASANREFIFSTSALQLPIILLIVLASIQLLPLGSAEAADSILNVPVTHALSMDPYATRFFLIRLLLCFVFFAAALVYLSPASRQKNIAVLIVIFGSLLAFFGILQRLAMPEAIYGVRPTPQAIPFGPYVNQHHFAALMEMTSGLALGLLFGGGVSRERKISLAVAAGIMGMAIVFTGSRGGLISYLAVIAFAAVASFVRARENGRRIDHDTRVMYRRNLLVLVAAGGLVILVLGSVLLLGGEASLLRSIGLQESSDLSSGRSHFWKIAWQVFVAHPILGSGFDSFGVAFTRYDTWSGQLRVEQAHNDYLQTLADGGILSFVAIAAFIILLIKNGLAVLSRRSNDIYRSISVGALAGCVGILIHSFFDFPLRTPANAFIFLLLVVLATGDVVRRKTVES